MVRNSIFKAICVAIRECLVQNFESLFDERSRSIIDFNSLVHTLNVSLDELNSWLKFQSLRHALIVLLTVDKFDLMPLFMNIFPFVAFSPENKHEANCTNLIISTFVFINARNKKKVLPRVANVVWVSSFKSTYMSAELKYSCQPQTKSAKKL